MTAFIVRTCPGCHNAAGSLEHALACLGQPRCPRLTRHLRVPCALEPGHDGSCRSSADVTAKKRTAA